MQRLDDFFQKAKVAYDSGLSPLDLILSTSLRAITLLASGASTKHQGSIGNKRYSVFANGKNVSRPFLPSSFVGNERGYARKWQSLERAINSKKNVIELSPADIDSVLYTSMTAFSSCYDLWNPRARKTPGTFLEVLIGSVIALIVPNYKRTKFITLPGESEKVSTDIVLKHPAKQTGLVIPAKITTRERIVQPFAHQRILDSFFGEGKYKSVLICVSEMQRQEDVGVNEICVPGTIKLFQKHLAKLHGIYYMDPPTRYMQDDLKAIIPIGSLGVFFSERLAGLL